MFFCSGIFFSAERISSKYKEWFLLNPMAGLIVAYRDVLLENRWPNWQYLAGVLAVSLLLVLVTVVLYGSREHDIARAAQN
jgi:lipopolysaccharide transport system permease protein